MRTIQAPPLGQGPPEVSRWVREMFSQVAGRYDFLNHLLSFQLDRYWRRRAAALLARELSSGGWVVDACCGTGDMALAIRHEMHTRVLGVDFSHVMLRRALRKSRSRSQLFWAEADALALPLADKSVSAVTMAFGFRNLADYDAGLREILRVLEPGGVALILEFSHPGDGWFGRAYRFYARSILPRVGGLISGLRWAYEYLPCSIERFPRATELAEQMRRVGFLNVRYWLLSGGIVAIHMGHAPTSA